MSSSCTTLCFQPRPPSAPRITRSALASVSTDLPEAEGFGPDFYLCSVALDMLTCLSFSEMIFVGCQETGLISLGSHACSAAASLAFTSVLSLVICMLYSLDL